MTPERQADYVHGADALILLHPYLRLDVTDDERETMRGDIAAACARSRAEGAAQERKRWQDALKALLLSQQKSRDIAEAAGRQGVAACRQAGVEILNYLEARIEEGE